MLDRLVDHAIATRHPYLEGSVLFVVGFVAMGAATTHVEGPGEHLGLVPSIVAGIGCYACIFGLTLIGLRATRAKQERGLRRALGGRERLHPSEEEEAALRRLVSDQLERIYPGRGHPSIRALKVITPRSLTDVRQLELSFPVDLATARDLARVALEATADGVLDDRGDLLRGWWQVGSDWSGAAVVVTLRLGSVTAGVTRVTLRSASKFWAAGREHRAQDALDRIAAGLRWRSNQDPRPAEGAWESPWGDPREPGAEVVRTSRRDEPSRPPASATP